MNGFEHTYCTFNAEKICNMFNKSEHNIEFRLEITITIILRIGKVFYARFSSFTLFLLPQSISVRPLDILLYCFVDEFTSFPFKRSLPWNYRLIVFKYEAKFTTIT